MTTISILGIDIAKNTFQLHGAICVGTIGVSERLVPKCSQTRRGIYIIFNKINAIDGGERGIGNFAR